MNFLRRENLFGLHAFAGTVLEEKWGDQQSRNGGGRLSDQLCYAKDIRLAAESHRRGVQATCSDQVAGLWRVNLIVWRLELA